MADKKRLIDANALLRKQYEIYEEGDPEVLFSTDFVHKVVSVENVKSAPTVDAVEVVRCKDCIYYHKRLGIGFGRCSKTSIYPYAEDFCSYGERRADA